MTGFCKLYVFIFILPLSIIYAQYPGYTISATSKQLSLGKSIEILEDKSGDLTIEDISNPELSDRFFLSDQEEPGFGFTSSVYWVKLTINNPLIEAINWYLEIGYPLLDYVDMYLPRKDGSFEIIKTGDRILFGSRQLYYRNFVFDLSEEAFSTKTYYLRFETSSSMNFPLQFWSKDQFLKKNISLFVDSK